MVLLFVLDTSIGSFAIELAAGPAEPSALPAAGLCRTSRKILGLQAIGMQERRRLLQHLFLSPAVQEEAQHQGAEGRRIKLNLNAKHAHLLPRTMFFVCDHLCLEPCFCFVYDHLLPRIMF